jgi:hypothetical protein
MGRILYQLPLIGSPLKLIFLLLTRLLNAPSLHIKASASLATILCSAPMLNTNSGRSSFRAKHVLSNRSLRSCPGWMYPKSSKSTNPIGMGLRTRCLWGLVASFCERSIEKSMTGYNIILLLLSCPVVMAIVLRKWLSYPPY